ncbi:MAG: site-specific integrase, partial [Actinomycetota bacterium]|nr:site-specific integrase [Actinomycetota bacterium]
MSRSHRFGSVRKLPSGRFQARYTHDGREKKASVTFPDEEAAERWLPTRRTEIDTGVQLLARPRIKGSLTFGEYAARWLPARRTRNGAELKPRTKVLYQQQLDRDLLPTFGRKPLTAITIADVTDWFNGYDQSKPTARAHAFALIKAILNSALLEQPPLIDANPARVKHGSQTNRRHRIKPATPAELAVIVENMPERLRAAVLIAAWGGLRFGEICELRRGDIDGSVIHVDRAVVRL